jgi:hypothetical protein
MNVNHFDVIGYRQDQLNKIFDATETGPIDTLLNSGRRQYDLQNKIIFNDSGWKGYFPVGQVLNPVASNIHSSFRKRFFKENGAVKGITSDSDFFIQAHNTVEEVVLSGPRGKLRAGKYLLLKYTDLQWRAFYDLLKIIDEKLIVAKVFMGLPFPNGSELFTFSMVREYSFDEMTVEDHRELYERAAVPSDPQTLEGTWNMTVVANSNHREDVAQLSFDAKPDGQVEAHYVLMRTIQGESQTELGPDQLRMNDFTPLHDEIRAIDVNYMLGKWITDQLVPFAPFSVGLLQAEPASAGQSRFGFYYTLRRVDADQRPSIALLDQILERRLGVGLTFKEQMDGSYYAGDTDRSPDHLLNLKPEDGPHCQFNVTMTIADVDKFVVSDEHRAELSGTIQFKKFQGDRDLALSLEPGSFFNYLILNPATDEHEMRYHLRFNHKGEIFVLDGTKFMQKDHKGDIREILFDYTTLFVQVTQESSGKIQGVALMKFRTFESPAAVASALQFGLSFAVTGSDNPAIQAAAIAKFNAMTTKFVLDEYNPLGL